MKIGVISDIHSNLEALRVVMEYLDHERVTDIYCCGDIVGYGSNPNECIDLLREYRVQAVTGNHDQAACGRADLSRFNDAGRSAIQWTRKRLTTDRREYLQQLPLTRDKELEQKTVSLVHGSPINPLWGYMFHRKDIYMSSRLQRNNTFLQLFGHTHQQALFSVQQDDITRQSIQEKCELIKDKEISYYLNPGSVGQPRDGNWRASLCILDVKGKGPFRVQFHRLEYDVEKTRQKILRAGLPKQLAIRLLSGI